MQAKTSGPDFATIYKSMEQALNVDFSALELLLHQEAMVDLLKFAQSLQIPEMKDKSEMEISIMAEQQLKKQETAASKTSKC